MRFARPENMKIVDMCKYIDDIEDKFNMTDKEKNTVYLYLYHIINSICIRHKFFYNEYDNDEFSTHFAEQLYYRIVNDNLPPIKNILDYIKKVMNGRKITWQQKDKFSEVLESYSTNKDYKNGNFIDVTTYKEQMKSEIESTSSDSVIKLVNSEIEELPKLIYKVCSLTQFKNDKSMTYKLYMSCLLSFINGVTLDKKTQELLDKKVDNGSLQDWFIVKCRLKNVEDSIVLWQLNDDMFSMVRVLMNRIKKMFIENIHNVGKKFEVSPEILDAMISLNYNDFRGNLGE